MPLADIDISDDDVVLAEGTEACRLFSDALDLWLSLTAMALVGAAQKAVELGVEYAKQRHAFGTAIGTFQAVSHPLADSATAADGARLLGLKAACSFVDEPERASELAAMAFTFAYETARDATRRSLHIHGGYGFGMEQDIQLYYRRARGWAMVYGEPATALDRLADMRYGAVTIDVIVAKRSTRRHDREAQRRAGGQPVATDVCHVDSYDDYSSCPREPRWRSHARAHRRSGPESGWTCQRCSLRLPGRRA